MSVRLGVRDGDSFHVQNDLYPVSGKLAKQLEAGGASVRKAPGGYTVSFPRAAARDLRAGGDLRAQYHRCHRRGGNSLFYFSRAVFAPEANWTVDNFDRYFARRRTCGPAVPDA
jgi:hypothetical protein